MPINVTCPGCHKRFTVSEKFAGKEGPCPNCKTKIRIPELSEQVVVHAPEEFGPKTRSGEAVLKPIMRSETKVSKAVWGVSIGSTLAVLIGAWMMRSDEPTQPLWLLATGAVLLALPIARLGYAFLRDDELEPYFGKSLWIRLSIVSVLYAASWAALTWLPPAAGYDELVHYEAGIFVSLVFAFGTAVAYLALDLEMSSAFLHYGFYLIATLLLRLLLGLPPLPVPVSF